MKTKKQDSDPSLEEKIKGAISGFYKSIGLGDATLNVVGIIDQNEADTSGLYTNSIKTVRITVKPLSEDIKVIFDSVHEATHAIHHFLMESGVNADNISSISLNEFNNAVKKFFTSSTDISAQEKETFAKFLENNGMTKDFIDTLRADYKYYPPNYVYGVYSTALSEVSANDIALGYTMSVLCNERNVIGIFEDRLVIKDQAHKDAGTIYDMLQMNQFSYYNIAISKDTPIRLKEQIKAHGTGFFSSVSRCFNEIKDLKWGISKELMRRSQDRLHSLLNFRENRSISQEKYDAEIKQRKENIIKQNQWTRKCMEQAHIPETQTPVPCALAKYVPEKESIFRTWVDLESENNATILAVDVDKRIIYYEKSNKMDANRLRENEHEDQSFERDRHEDGGAFIKTADKDIELDER